MRGFPLIIDTISRISFREESLIWEKKMNFELKLN